MRCPHLREAQVKFCRGSAFRKMIVRAPAEVNERCTSPDYVHCPSVKEHREEHPSQSHCPFLQESLMQYCAVSPKTQFVPYTESFPSHCANESHRYCEIFIGLASPEGMPPETVSRAGGNSACENVQGVKMPLWLQYSRNHFWLDRAGDGTCHIGVDGFLARLLGHVQSVSFTSTQAAGRPAATLTAGGVDFTFIFPRPLQVRETNAALRADPGRIISHPYTLGWMFGGTAPDSGISASPGKEDLLEGREAQKWMEGELRRLSAFVRDQLAAREPELGALMADGGTVADGLVRQLTRDEILKLFNEFFSPYAGGERA